MELGYEVCAIEAVLGEPCFIPISLNNCSRRDTEHEAVSRVNYYL